MTKKNQNRLWIAPSILSADFGRLAEEIRDVEEAGCDLIHVDVMDGHFVPNITIGPLIVRFVRKATRLPLDVHLMIDEPLRHIEAFREAGSDWLTVHFEGIDDIGGTLKAVKRAGLKCGISLKPKSPVEVLEPYLGEVDLVLVMTVEPGFGGQSFMPEMMGKLKWLRPRFSGLISVDGGIHAGVAGQVRKEGADILVAGTAVFGKKDRARAVKALRQDG